MAPEALADADAVVLGIESSCDELAAAVVRGGREVLASRVRGQEEVHAAYGGVVPELASRDHVRGVSGVVHDALAAAQLSPSELTGVAVTAGPGLLGSLLVGLSFAKGLAYRHTLPLVGVHHLAGHLAAAEMVCPDLRLPYLGLVVSGGHTALYRVSEARPQLLGETRDDAVGEAFDKVAKLLGLPFPGGPALAALADAGDETALAFPRPMADRPGLDFSYSGLKTAVLQAVEARQPLTEAARADIAASFQAAATDVLVSKAVRAARQGGFGQVALVGGVAANRRLRESLRAAGERHGFQVFAPPPALCTDNAAMIAAAGTRLFAAGSTDGLELSAFSRVPLGEEPWRAGA